MTLLAASALGSTEVLDSNHRALQADDVEETLDEMLDVLDCSDSDCEAALPNPEDAEDYDPKGQLIKPKQMTAYFSPLDGYYQGDNQDVRGTTWVGMGLGFGAIFIFFIVVGVNIVIDERKRMAYFQQKVKTYTDRLEKRYEWIGSNDIKAMREKFEERERLGDKKEDDDAKKEDSHADSTDGE